METIGAYAAKTHLLKLFERVHKGERITITRHGVPVAVSLLPKRQQKADPRRIISELRKFRKQHHLNGLSLREMGEERNPAL